ncbi:arginine--tRNA ligase [Helicobacter bilis]|uniref:arginine--tRNA ligase n=1 Tax=Helicobacter bilis TaxID=37372 RepID=UPI000AFBB368|nr:arginine--tRNA ligase [Helicobacter bilis]MCI7410402.1 arginine--tRNA ligase [Helicobacter bilis]MDD7296884.1 arginine--tRNA ligase [Helicobacter bilis]MDY4399793.1 arginine--tRNA ligase [Helicobacter bilis]
MYYKVKEFLTEATKAYLSSIGRTDIVVQQGTNNALNQKKISSKHNANISQDSIIESKTESKKDSSSSQEKINLIIALEHPKDKRHGHFATPLCFTLTKILRTNPKVLAQSLQDFFIQYDLDSNSTKPFKKMFSSIEALNGYLNLTLTHSFLTYMLEVALQSPKDFAKGECKNTKILLEYVSANPTGPLHIGHARGAIFGSVLQRIGKRLGYDIKGEYYINDAGSQIDMLALSVYNSAAKILNLESLSGEVYKGEYIDSVAQDAIKHFGESFFRTTDSQKTDILQKIGLYAKDMMLEVIKENLASLSIDFDYFVSEKELYTRFDDTMKTLEAHNALLHQNGAIWLQSTLKGDEKDRVLVRDNGMPTYMAGDIIYHKDKFDRDYNHYINIWGADHHGYIVRIKASIDFLGFDSNNLEVLLAQMVSLLKDGQPYKMSKRAGNFILIQDVVNDIGADSLKFVFLSKSLDTHLEFDVQDLSKEDSSNPVFYINYANARIHTLLEKSNLSLEDINKTDLSTLLDSNDSLGQDSMQLILQSLGLFYVLNQSYEERALQKLCEYLKNLAKSFHTFYNAHRILQTQHEAGILKIFLLVSLSLTTGFNMLGINIKTKM